MNKRNFRFELERQYAKRFSKALRKKGYRTFTEWAREKVRELVDGE